MLNRDEEYLGKLRDYYAEHRGLPSFAAIGKLLNLRSTSSVAAMVKRMRDVGYLESGHGGRIQPGDRFFERSRSEVPVPAGIPQAAQDVTSDTVAIDTYLIDEPSRTLLIRVKGDSMVNAGLLPDDTVVVKRGAPAQPGDIVVARVDGEYTIKYLARDKKGFYLRPGNDAYTDIKPKEELDLFGRVVGAYRKY